MQIRRLALVGLLFVLAGCGSPQSAQNTPDSQDKPNVTEAAKTFDPDDGMPDIAAGAPELAEIPTPAPVGLYDPDGDGFTDTHQMIQSVDGSWEAFLFPPGFQFAIERFHTEFDPRAERNDERWEIRYNYLIISNAQTCAWVEFWLNANTITDVDAITEANRMLKDVIPNNFIYHSMQDYVLSVGNAAVLGDISTIQASVEVLRCADAYYRPDWSGPVSPTPASHVIPTIVFHEFGTSSAT